MRATLSPVANMLMRSLLQRAGLDPSLVYVSKFQSVDWQSLTFTGERHEFCLRFLPPSALEGVARLREGLGECEWSLPGHVVADILIVGERTEVDGSILVEVEALTLAD